MVGIGWFMSIILGGLAGYIAEKIMKADMGVLANIIAGILGAVLLNGLLQVFNIIPPEGWLMQCIVGIVGACIVIALYRMLFARKTVL